MVSDTDAMTHEDMWDDSALIESWNQALDEYKVRRSVADSVTNTVSKPEKHQP